MVAISNLITSICSYFQNLGATISASNLNVPPQLKKIMNSVTQFLNTLEALIPSIPAFDIRAQLVIMAIGIPFILDVIFVWFVSPFGQVISHLIDIAVVGVGTFYLTQSLIFQWTQGTSVIVLISCIYLGIRIMMKLCCRSKGNKFQLYALAQNICTHFLKGIMPNMSEERGSSIKDIKQAVRTYSAVVEIAPSKARALPMTILFLISAFLIFLSFISINAFGNASLLPSGIRVFLPYIGFPFSIILLADFFMHLCACGRRAITAFKNFCKRWGLRILMLFLDLLYIPILTYLVANLIPKKVGCPAGQYLYYDHGSTTTDPLFSFVNHSAVCKPCWETLANVSSVCQKACDGHEDLRMFDAHNLLFVQDELKTFGGVLIYSVVAILIGIPGLWSVIVVRNVNFIKRINVYGKTKAAKWIALVNRMRTTGIFLFCNFADSYSKWNIWLQFVKLVVMTITTLSARVNNKISFALIGWYSFVVVYYLLKRPYLYLFNNIVDPLLYTCNLIITLIPVFAALGKPIPQSYVPPISAVIIIAPFLSLIFLFFCRKGPTAEEDPTIEPEQSDDDELEDQEIVKENRRSNNNQNIQRDNYRHHRRHHNHGHRRHGKSKRQYDYDDEEEDDEDEVDYRNDWGQPVEFDENLYRTRCQFIEQPDLEDENVDSLRIELTPPQLMSMSELEMFEIRDSLNIASAVEKEPFMVKRGALARRCTHMYDMLDVVIDGSTIEILTHTLSWVVIAAAIAFGWYLGASNAYLATAEDIFCG